MQLNSLVLFLVLIIIPDLYAVNRRLQTDSKRLLEKVQQHKFGESKEEWVEQKLDHFNPADVRTFQQRYFSLDDYYKPGGPVFLLIQGAGAASDDWFDDTPNFSDTAKDVNASLFILEHRYYGETQPTENLTLENLQYLSSEQALADTADFIEAMNAKHNFSADTKWIAYGASYAGSLAAWARLKYPHLIFGAVASSAPLQAVVDFKDFNLGVENSVKSHSPQCLNAISNAFEDFAALTKNASGRQVLTDTFYLCETLDEATANGTKKNKLTHLYNTLIGAVAQIIQYDQYVAANTTSIDLLCEVMLDESKTPVQNLAAVAGGESKTFCLDYNYDNFVGELKTTFWESYAAFEGLKQWYYQSCNEFGFFQTASAAFQNLVNISYFEDLCRDIYSTNFNLTYLESAVNQTNVIYGGTDINVTNVIFVNGEVDPWHAVGLLETKDPSSPAILIEGASFCANLFPIQQFTPPQLVNAIAQIDTILRSWLK